MSTLLGIFAKYWIPGTVKTRLAQTIGDETAAQVHRLLVESLLARFESVADRQILSFSPPSAQGKLSELPLGRWELVPQASGDLGMRMKHFFASSLGVASDSGSSNTTVSSFGGNSDKDAAPVSPPRVLLIGSDSPDLPHAYLQEALDALRTVSVVLGPTDDGGYYLVGMSRFIPELFDDIAWSTPAVWSQTVDRLATRGIPYHVLPQWYDIDTAPDLNRLLTSLEPSDPLSISLRSLLPPPCTTF